MTLTPESSTTLTSFLEKHTHLQKMSVHNGTNTRPPLPNATDEKIKPILSTQRFVNLTSLSLDWNSVRRPVIINRHP